MKEGKIVAAVAISSIEKFIFLQSLFSLYRISKSLTLVALSKHLPKSFFTNIKEPLLSKNQLWGFVRQNALHHVLVEIGSSLLLKLASFNVLLVTYRSSSPCISSPKLLVANKNFFTSSLLFKIVVLRKINYVKPVLLQN